MKRRSKIWIGWGCLFLAATFAIVWRLRPPVHQHCIKIASGFFSQYASEHHACFPESDRGWADALLKLQAGSGNTDWVRYVVGVDDDGSHLIEALGTGQDVDEDQCSRIYVQGLSQSSDQEIVILFDRNSVKGGDHFRGMPGQKRLREVLTVGGIHQNVPDSEWAGFVTRQRELLRKEGFDESQITGIYGPD